MKNHVQQRFMHANSSVVFDESQLAEAVHEEADSRSRGADHVGQSLLGDRRNQCLRLTRLAKFGHQQKNARQPLFAGIKELVDQVGLNAHASRQQERQEQVRKRVLFVHYADHLIAHDFECRAARDGSGCRQTQSSDGSESFFSDKILWREQGDCGFFSRLGNYRDFAPAFL